MFVRISYFFGVKIVTNIVAFCVKLGSSYDYQFQANCVCLTTWPVARNPAIVSLTPIMENPPWSWRLGKSGVLRSSALMYHNMLPRCTDSTVMKWQCAMKSTNHCSSLLVVCRTGTRLGQSVVRTYNSSYKISLHFDLWISYNLIGLDERNRRAKTYSAYVFNQIAGNPKFKMSIEYVKTFQFGKNAFSSDLS